MSGVQRAAQRRRSSWGLLVPLVFAVAGLLFVASAETSRGTDLRGGERSRLADLVRAESARVDGAAAEVADLQAAVDELTARTAGAGGSSLAGLTERADRLAPAAHLQPVRGPGLRVVLSDADTSDPARLPPDVGPNDLVVHQQDLQAVVNAMWAGGAEAIQLMDQRIISTSAVRCVGNVLILQGRVYPPPYEVTAVGDVEGMRTALAASPALDTYRFFVDYVGLGYEETEVDEVTLPGFTGGLDLQYATVPPSAAGATAAG